MLGSFNSDHTQTRLDRLDRKMQIDIAFLMVALIASIVKITQHKTKHGLALVWAYHRDHLRPPYLPTYHNYKFA